MPKNYYMCRGNSNDKDIAKEYILARSIINKWVSDYNNTHYFKAKDNRSGEEDELIKLRKGKAMLIMGRR